MKEVIDPAVLRSGDTYLRSEAGVAIVHVETLMRELVRTMPAYETEVEAKRYLEAVKDVALQINAATYRHDSDTGELVRSAETVAVSTDVVDQEYSARFGR